MFTGFNFDILYFIFCIMLLVGLTFSVFFIMTIAMGKGNATLWNGVIVVAAGMSILLLCIMTGENYFLNVKDFFTKGS